MHAFHPRMPVLATLVATAMGLGACGSSGDDDSSGSTTAAATTAGGVDTGDVGDGGSGNGDGGGGSASEQVRVVSRLDDVGGSINSFGYVAIQQGGDGLDDESNVAAGFFRAALEVPARDAAVGFAPPLDTCTVSEFDLGDEIPDVDRDFEVETISAGENLVFTSAAGTWLTLPRVSAFGFEIYGFIDEDVTIPLPVPTGLTVDIPGAAFPAFANVPIPDVDVITGVDTGSGPITADTVFRWDIGSNPDLAVVIEASSFNASTLRDVTCYAVDDGEFAFPAATRGELGTDFSALQSSVSRVGLNFVTRGDALLVVSNISGSS